MPRDRLQSSKSDIKRRDVVKSIVEFVEDEKRSGRTKPNRRTIETRIRLTDELSQRQVNEALIEIYNNLVLLGLVPPRVR